MVYPPQAKVTAPTTKVTEISREEILKPRIIEKDTHTIKNKINKLFKKLINK